MPRCGVPARSKAEGGTGVVKLTFRHLIPSPDAALGDGDSAARCPYHHCL